MASTPAEVVSPERKGEGGVKGVAYKDEESFCNQEGILWPGTLQESVKNSHISAKRFPLLYYRNECQLTTKQRSPFLLKVFNATETFSCGEILS